MLCPLASARGGGAATTEYTDDPLRDAETVTEGEY